MAFVDPNAERPKRKRRWLQFSLRSLLIFTLVCAIGAAWVARRMEQTSRRCLDFKRCLSTTPESPIPG
jgi:hypothetical protein